MTTVAEPRKVQLRCHSQIHGIVKHYPNGKVLLEVRCKNKLCVDRKAKGIVVLHYLNVETGELVSTKRFRDPAYPGPGHHERSSETT